MSSNNVPILEAPPANPRRLRDNRYAASAELAWSRPGEWVRMPGSYGPSVAWMVRNGRLAAFRGGVWEATSRSTDADRTRYDVWIRYLGPEAGQG
jgi:hypothetical protein